MLPPLSGRWHCVIPYGTWVPVVVRQCYTASCYTCKLYLYFSLLYPSKAGTWFSNHEEMQGSVDLVGYIPRWYTHPKMVTHPITNQAQRRVTSLISQWCYRNATPPELAAHRRKPGPGLQKISWQSCDNLMIMPKLRSTYDGRLIYKTSYEERKVFLRYDSLETVFLN